MAQVYVPDDPRVREQLEQGGTAAAREEKRMPPARRRRFGVIDLVVFLGVVAAITLLVLAASRWTAPLTPNVAISLSPAVLPAYAGYSLLRMLLAYLLSLVFTLIYGHVAANNRRAERVMIPLLDILQSVPILSFLPAVTLTLVALFPHSNIGLELASVILIFTSQAWNMTFSYYHSARTLPTDLQEVTAVARVRPWRRFLILEVPSSMIGLIWNSMMSWAGGWFFLMASEQFTLGSRSFQLPGLGSYLQAAANAGNTGAILLGLATLIALIVLLDLLFWRPLVAWADKFKVEQSSGADTPHSPVLDALRRSSTERCSARWGSSWHACWIACSPCQAPRHRRCPPSSLPVSHRPGGSPGGCWRACWARWSSWGWCPCSGCSSRFPCLPGGRCSWRPWPPGCAR